MTCHFLLLIISVGTVGFVSGYTLNHSMTLTADMLTGYDRRHRPIQNQSTPIQVSPVRNLNLNCSFSLTRICFVCLSFSRITALEYQIVIFIGHLGYSLSLSQFDTRLQ